MSHWCSGGMWCYPHLDWHGAQPLTWGGYGIKWPASTWHVLCGHTGSFGSNSSRWETAVHCSLPSADLYIGFQAVEDITTASKGLLQSPILKSLASLFAANSPWHLLQHLGLFSASPYQLFLTFISHLHSLLLSSEQQFPPAHIPSQLSKLIAANPWDTFTQARHCWQQGCHAQSSFLCSGKSWPGCFQDTDTGWQDETGTIPESFPLL